MTNDELSEMATFVLRLSDYVDSPDDLRTMLEQTYPDATGDEILFVMLRALNLLSAEGAKRRLN
ncbi:hypothetical protein [Aureimonas jatrophae]|uniref:Uncharacterized protein n=1 Tax=Aureimonas jatrophae TaxID=1166073 RepID=A0A1H0IHY8_9HYPH|nr:hypothetical protein [Aureimonas jatrophae]MBB3952186.1 hypothetical protein [Aureimonas jatrophae]SDO31089.1 hypothetical protein SAMN05192530_105162 [Aureimonas jatrophae]